MEYKIINDMNENLAKEIVKYYDFNSTINKKNLNNL